MSPSSYNELRVRSKHGASCSMPSLYGSAIRSQLESYKERLRDEHISMAQQPATCLSLLLGFLTMQFPELGVCVLVQGCRINNVENKTHQHSVVEKVRLW